MKSKKEEILIRLEKWKVGIEEEIFINHKNEQFDGYISRINENGNPLIMKYETKCRTNHFYFTIVSSEGRDDYDIVYYSGKVFIFHKDFFKNFQDLVEANKDHYCFLYTELSPRDYEFFYKIIKEIKINLDNLI